MDIDLGTGVMVAPVAGQGEEYEWEYAGIEDEGEGIDGLHPSRVCGG